MFFFIFSQKGTKQWLAQTMFILLASETHIFFYSILCRFVYMVLMMQPVYAGIFLICLASTLWHKFVSKYHFLVRYAYLFCYLGMILWLVLFYH